MAVPYCRICETHEDAKQRYGDTGLQDGDFCPICFRPTCRFHLGRVIWRWKENGQRAEAFVCLDCKNAYRHREWDAYHRDWVS